MYPTSPLRTEAAQRFTRPDAEKRPAAGRRSRVANDLVRKTPGRPSFAATGELRPVHKGVRHASITVPRPCPPDHPSDWVDATTRDTPSMTSSPERHSTRGQEAAGWLGRGLAIVAMAVAAAAYGHHLGNAANSHGTIRLAWLPDAVLGAAPVLGVALLLALLPYVKDFLSATAEFIAGGPWNKLAGQAIVAAVMLFLSAFMLGAARAPELPPLMTVIPSPSIGVAVRLTEVRFPNAALVDGRVTGPGVTVSGYQRQRLQQLAETLDKHCTSGHLEIRIAGFPSDTPFRGEADKERNNLHNLAAANLRARAVYDVLKEISINAHHLRIVEPTTHASWDRMAAEREVVRRYQGVPPEDRGGDSDRTAVLILGGGSNCPTWPFEPLAAIVAGLSDD